MEKTKNNWIEMNMTKIIKTVLLIIVPFLLLYAYRSIACFYSNKNFVFDMICSPNWSLGLIICIIFSFVSLYEIAFEFSANIFLKWLIIILAYIFVVGVLYFPLMIVSFINFDSSSFLHFIPILISLDLINKRIEKG